MDNNEKEEKYWLNELRYQLINRLDDVDTALNKLDADAMFKGSNNTTGPLEHTMHHLGVCVTRLDESEKVFVRQPILTDFAKQFEKA